jgi:fatty acid omega-hydroxylase
MILFHIQLETQKTLQYNITHSIDHSHIPYDQLIVPIPISTSYLHSAIQNMAAATEDLFCHILFFLKNIQIIEIIIASIVFLIIHSLRSKKHHSLPNWPIIGMIGGLKTNIYEGITDILKNQNRTFRFKGPRFTSVNFIITSTPQNLEHLLKTKFTKFPKGIYFRDTVSDLLGDCIFAADNETWQKQGKHRVSSFNQQSFG